MIGINRASDRFHVVCLIAVNNGMMVEGLNDEKYSLVIEVTDKDVNANENEIRLMMPRRRLG